MVPIEKANPMKCRLCTTGKAHSGPFMAFAQGLVVSHSKNDAAGMSNQCSAIAETSLPGFW